MSILSLADQLPLKDGALAARNTDPHFQDVATVTCTLVATIALLLGHTPWLVGEVSTVGFSWELVSAVHVPIVLVYFASACECEAACCAGIESLTSVQKRLVLLIRKVGIAVLMTKIRMLAMLVVLMMSMVPGPLPLLQWERVLGWGGHIAQTQQLAGRSIETRTRSMELLRASIALSLSFAWLHRQRFALADSLPMEQWALATGHAKSFMLTGASLAVLLVLAVTMKKVMLPVTVMVSTMIMAMMVVEIGRAISLATV